MAARHGLISLASGIWGTNPLGLPPLNLTPTRISLIHELQTPPSQT